MARFRRHKYKHGKKFSIKASCTNIKMKNHKYKYILKNRRILVILLSLAVISITVMPSYAYFTGTADWNSLNSGLNDLTIDNGSVNFKVSKDEAIWKNSNIEITEVSNPAEGQEINYGPIWVEQLDSTNNLTSKVDLLTEYQVDKVGGSEEVPDASDNKDEDLTVEEPFEVIVGDIDNFGYIDDNLDPYKQDEYLQERVGHAMDVFPSSYDAKGTDRRMVGSGFYNALPKDDSGKIHEFNATDLYDDKGNINNKMNKKDAAFFGYKSSESNNHFLYDGYTDRAIRGVKGDGVSDASDCYMDGVNWRYIQKAEPITFKYGSITKEIKTVTFQIFTDDIQSWIAQAGDKGAFQSKSGSQFKVYLNETEIPEFSSQINYYAQSGPKGNIVTLELSAEHFNIVENAGGLDGSGLKLLIDDTNGQNGKSYYTGDSFAIDFAKMTVNAPATGSDNDKYYGYVSGTVCDSNNNPLEGVTVITETGETCKTGVDGKFIFNRVYKGTAKLTLKKDNYKEKIIYAKTDVDYGIVKMDYAAIVMQEKCQVEITVTKCNLAGETLRDSANNPIYQITKKSTDLNNSSYYIRKSGTVIAHSFKLDFEPGCKYKLEYKVKLRNRASLKDLQDFNLNFTINSIKIKATQENNPVWEVAGTGDDYTDKYSDGDNDNIDVNKTLPSSTTGGTTGSSEKHSEIYFNVPDNGTFGSFENSSFALNGTLLNDKYGKKIKLNSAWWQFLFDGYNKIDGTSNSNKGSIIQVKSSGGDSGKLYWFTTQKVFICTN